MIERAVCYDLDQTLIDGRNLRPGVEGLLRNLQRNSTANILTTAGGGWHLQEVFSRTGIDRLLLKVFEGHQIDVGAGKLYRPVAEALGYSPSEASRKMIVTGDMESDRPADIPLVFVHDPSGFRHDASLLHRMIQHLWSAGRGSFIDGFSRIERNQNTRFERRELDYEDVGVGTVLDGKTLVTLSFQDPTEGGRKLPRFTPGIIIPTLRVVSANAKRHVVRRSPDRKVRIFG